MNILMTQLLSVTCMALAINLPYAPISDVTQHMEEVQREKQSIENKIENNNLIPEGWALVTKNNGEDAIVEGDLNDDGINDFALIIEKTNVCKRHLIIATGDENGIFMPAVIGKNAVLSVCDGGVYGDPLDNLMVDRGSLVLSFFGGSSERWYRDYSFQYQDSGWFLIGATEGTLVEVNDAMDHIEEDYNLLTGDYIFRKLKKGKIITTEGNRGVKELVNLWDFDVNSENDQY